MLNQGYGKIINTASMASLIGEWWELTVVLQNPYFNYYRCYLNQLNLYWEGVNHWHFVLEEMYYKIFIDTIFQHLSVLYVLEHLLLFIEEAESPPLTPMHWWHRRGAGALPRNFRQTRLSAASCASVMFTSHLKAFVLVFAPVPAGFISLSLPTGVSTNAAESAVSSKAPINHCNIWNEIPTAELIWKAVTCWWTEAHVTKIDQLHKLSIAL